MLGSGDRENCVKKAPDRSWTFGYRTEPGIDVPGVEGRMQNTSVSSGASLLAKPSRKSDIKETYVSLGSPRSGLCNNSLSKSLLFERFRVN